MDNENDVFDEKNESEVVESVSIPKVEETQHVETSTETYVTQNHMQGNPYSQGTVYGKGIYTGEVFQTDQVEPKHSKPKKNGTGKKVFRLVGSAVAFGLVAGCVMVGVNVAGSKLFKTEKQTPQIPTVTTSDAMIQSGKSDNGSGYADVAEQVMPSIVSITNTSVQTVRSWFQSYEQEVSGSGSGIIIGKNDNEILIVTNNHVIDGAKELTVAFCDKTAVPATVKGADPLADLAVVAVNVEDLEDGTLDNIRVAAIGSSDELRVGEGVIAIGNALGYGQSLTAGYISALDREVDVEENSMTLLQTDAAINPGNSGGALLNTKGELIGINTVKYVDSKVEGMGYAIPISSAIPIINDLMNKQVIKEEEQGYLGIQGNDVTDEYAASFNMPKGVYVVKIVDGAPADQCGLKAGDIITKFAGRDVNSFQALQTILSGKKAGEEVEMVVQRNTEKGEYEEVTLKVVLGAKKDMPETEKRQQNKQETKEKQDEQRQENPYENYEEYMTPDDIFEHFFGN
ncbi:MAG: trypsin-like peptidase domain-containing protein [Eubacteriales bacterium]|nr:trypsin-like peptidase domain-containing protein [Eubacteriales bacterium]